MDTAASRLPLDATSPRTDRSPLFLAGLASLGAGAIHAAAIGVHSEHKQAVYAFAIVAAAQLAWGALGLVKGNRFVALLGVLVNGAALGGWLLAKTKGISFIDGLEEVEGVQLADGGAAALAAISVFLALPLLLRPSSAPARESRLASSNLARAAVTVVVTLFAATAMVAAGQHSHAHGHVHSGAETAAGHVHSHGAAGSSGSGHTHLTPQPYDPSKPIDLGGYPGVTSKQQAAAENEVARTLIELPQFADYKVAVKRGYASIGDAITGYEHFINWDYIDDDHVLDPNYPESLVYRTNDFGQHRKLVSAMFMLPQGSTLEDVPELGGALTQWHIHDNLCFTQGPNPQVRGITSVGGTCRPPLQKFKPVPMIHVWITPHPCGPFAALEGVGAGQIKAGQERLCDHVHGSAGGP